MTRDEIHHIKRAAQAAKILRIEAGATAKYTFRAMDTFSRVATPDAIERLCEAALGKQTACPTTESDAVKAPLDALAAAGWRFERLAEGNYLVGTEEGDSIEISTRALFGDEYAFCKLVERLIAARESRHNDTEE